jgi:hypothetical protein
MYCWLVYVAIFAQSAFQTIEVATNWQMKKAC